MGDIEVLRELSRCALLICKWPGSFDDGKCSHVWLPCPVSCAPAETCMCCPTNSLQCLLFTPPSTCCCPPPGPLFPPAAPRYVLPKGGTSEWRGRLGTAMALLLGSKLLNVQVG